MSLSRVFRVLHKLGPPYSVLLESRQFEDGLLLESGTVVSLTPQEKEELKSDYTKAIDAYGCLGVMMFGDDKAGKARSLYLVLVTACMPVGKLLNCEVFRITGASFFSLQNGTVDADSRCTDVKKLLSSGKFYFTWSAMNGSEILDLTVSFQDQDKKNDDQRFFWNHLLHLHFKHFGADCALWLFRVMCGGIDIRTVYVGAQQARAVVISRLSCERAGTRFNVRGADDEGHVANFVESEQAIILGENVSSFMQIRGSIPLFWGQPGLNVGSHKIKISRGFEASAPTYDRHFSSIVDNYGQCLIVNLLGSKGDESMLSRLFQLHHEKSAFSEEVTMFCFDYHCECRGKSENLSKLKTKIWDKLESYGCYTYKDDEKLRITQTGVIRINCLDCLDRTNSTKTYFGMQMLPKQLESLGLGNNKQLEDRFREAFKTAWPITGDLISRMYAGTGALEGKTKFKDGARSVTRAIQNNFLDQSKQGAIDLLILGTNSADIELMARANNLMSGDCLRAPTAVLRGMCDKFKDYTSILPIRVAIGTWNVNGGKHFRSLAYKDQTLDDWLIKCEQSPTNNFYKALYDFSSAEEGDLSFASGDIIDVHHALEDGEWMSGSCNGCNGIFPAAYVTKLLPRYTALYDFPAHQEGDLDFVAGDTIEVTEMTGEWWKGRVSRDEYNPDELEGTFPASYVEIFKDSLSSDSFSNLADNNDAEVDWNKAMDFYVIGFQEMVELSAGNIVNTSHTNQHTWGIELQKTISNKYKYVLLASEQLVGVCFYVFVRPHHTPHIRDVEIGTVKTGLGGATGNKGGIGIRMQFHNSSLCFVCSHLAAGQGQVQDRNNDFAEISKKMVFSGNKSIYCHDYIFWCGDLNYRIDMPIDEVKQLVVEKDWKSLQSNDQLCTEKKEGRVFQCFLEGDTNFAPTYKYDLFSDDYDTSEKSRTPAWTDRVLWFRRKWFADTQDSGSSLVSVSQDPEWNPGKLLYYNKADIKTSDHRPVIAILDVDIIQSDEEHLNTTFHKFVEAQGPPDATILISLTQEENTGDIPLSGELFEAIMSRLNEIGEVIITRHFKGKLMVIFSDGTAAVRATDLNETSVDGTLIYVTLKSRGWEEDVEHELRQHSHSFSANESYAEKYANEGEPCQYNYDVYHNDAEHEEDSSESPRYEYNTYHQTSTQLYDIPVSEATDTINESNKEVMEDVNDPGWAFESEHYSYSYMPPNPELTKKVSAPPRPSSGPVKKRAPPRPNTLPTMPSGPPPLPSQSPSIMPGPPTAKPGLSIGPQSTASFTPLEPSTILIPEPAPLPSRPPRATARSRHVPKRKAPAPPPNTAGMPPPLPLTPPKGPPKVRSQHMNAAFIPENHSEPSLLDLDPYAPTSAHVPPRPVSAGVLIPSVISGTKDSNPPTIAPRKTPATMMPLPTVSKSANVWYTKQETNFPPPRVGQPHVSQRPNNMSMVAEKPQSNLSTGPFTVATPLDNHILVPLRPTPAPKSISNKAKSVPSVQNDPFHLAGQQYVLPFTSKPLKPQVPPKNDPWGTSPAVDKNSNDIPNSFSTDFSKMSFNQF
ncbi:synaptojanin-1-like [Styela clava]